jgi:hypothetical protein
MSSPLEAGAVGKIESSTIFSNWILVIQSEYALRGRERMASDA